MNEILEDCEKIKQNTYLPLKKGKVKKLENYIYQSNYSSFLEKKSWNISENKKLQSSAEGMMSKSENFLKPISMGDEGGTKTRFYLFNRKK